MTPGTARALVAVQAAIDSEENATVQECLHAVAIEIGMLIELLDASGVTPPDEVAAMLNDGIEAGKSLYHAAASAVAEADRNAN